jgi:hypothetical protein
LIHGLNKITFGNKYQVNKFLTNKIINNNNKFNNEL